MSERSPLGISEDTSEREYECRTEIPKQARQRASKDGTNTIDEVEWAKASQEPNGTSQECAPAETGVFR
jgi:hypothetical protein